MYEVYTFPACAKCQTAVETFRERGIEFEEIGAGTSEGLRRIRELFKTHKDEIRRDEINAIMMPLIIHRQEKEIRLYQGEEGIEKILENENNRVS